MEKADDSILFLLLILVGFFWGITNPFLKRGTDGIEKIREPNTIKKGLMELLFVLTNWKYILPFLVNQCGSLLYISILKHSSLTVAVPVANGFGFVFTAVGGWLLGESIPDKRSTIGMLLVACGLSCYIVDSAMKEA